MKKLLFAVAVLVVTMAGIIYAGRPGGDPPPPCTGSPIEVYNADRCGASKWIQVNDSSAVCDIICQMTRTRKQTCPQLIAWIVGTVVLDAADPAGWKFDPNSIIVAEVTADGMQTNTCMINANPSRFAGAIWYIPQGFSQYRLVQ